MGSPLCDRFVNVLMWFSSTLYVGYSVKARRDLVSRCCYMQCICRSPVKNCVPGCVGTPFCGGSAVRYAFFYSWGIPLVHVSR